MRLVREAPGRGVKVFIVGAGAAAHLAGVVAAHTSLPVIGVPIDSSALKGLDALLSTVQMPPGVPVATVSIGKPGATNAGVLAGADPRRRPTRRLSPRGSSEYKKKLADKVEQAAAPSCRARRLSTSSREVRHRHLRLPREPGGLAPHRGRSARCAADATPGGRRRSRHRQHLLGDGDRRPGRAADDPPHRARQSARAHRRDRLLRHAVRRRRRGAAERRPRSSRNDDKDSARRRRCSAAIAWPTALRGSGDGDGPCGAASSPASPGAPRSRCGCRPAAKSAAPTASSRRRAAPAAACRSRTFVREVGASRPPASRKSRSPASTSDRTDAT